jgi:hypothetical protein
MIPDAGTPRSARPEIIPAEPSGRCSPEDSVEPLGAECGIITKVKVDVTLERAIGVERSPAAAAHVVALVGASP